MPNQQSLFVIQQKLESLRVKIAAQQLLVQEIQSEIGAISTSISAIFQHSGTTTPIAESSPSDIEHSSHNNESTSSNVESTSFGVERSSHNVESTPFSIESSSHSVESTSSNIESSSHNVESTSSNAESSSLLIKLTAKIREAAKNTPGIQFGAPNIPERLGKELALLVSKKQVTAGQMENAFRVSRKSIVRDAAILKQLGWIRFVGSRKNGYYVFTVEGETMTK
jgi:hypothetical protein